MILVMGATGQVGSKITAHLLANNETVRCLARHFPKPDLFQGADLAQGDANDVAFLSQAMRGCKSVFTFIPNDKSATEVRYSQNKYGEVIAEAIEEAGIKKVVNLSSVGADLETGTGPILGLHDQELRLNEITHADIVHLRPAFFMENLLSSIPTIITDDRIYNVIPSEIPFPMIATRDIASRAAFLLMHPDFKDSKIEYLLGERDISMEEVASVLSNSLKKNNLKYSELSPDEMKQLYLKQGINEDWADSYIELSIALGNGTIAGTIERDKINTTATTIEEFSRTTFAEAYRTVLSQELNRRMRQHTDRDAHL